MATLAAWIHNIDPFAVQFPQGFILDGIRWYGLAYLATFALGFAIARRIARVGITTVRPAEIMDFVITVAIGVIAGGRLGYVIFYKPQLLIDFDGSVPFWGLFRLNEGGMSSHGGMLGVGFAVWWYAWRSRRHTIAGEAEPALKSMLDAQGNLAAHLACVDCKYDLFSRPGAGNCPECGTPVKQSMQGHNWLHLFDFASFVATIGFFFGRIANFINAELIGRICPPDTFLAIKFPTELPKVASQWIRSSTANTEAAAPLYALTDAVAHINISAAQWHEAIAKHNIDFVDRAIAQLILAIQDGGERGSTVGQLVAPLLDPHYPSQIYAALTEGLIIFIVLAIIWRIPRKPGIITATFGMLYGIMRVFNEFFRAPDAHIQDQEFAALNLTRGQLLSIVLTIASIALLIWCARRDLPRMGGWLKRDKPRAA